MNHEQGNEKLKGGSLQTYFILHWYLIIIQFLCLSAAVAKNGIANQKSPIDILKSLSLGQQKSFKQK